MAIPTHSGGTTTPVMDNHKVIVWVGSAILFIVLYQYKPVKPYVMTLGLILIVGIMLRYYPNIRNQFSNLGR